MNEIQLIRRFAANLTGKDYICSDIHGHFSILQQALTNLGFDEQHDRLFSLGDLIDRGDESHLALEWLAKPWFFAIQGNHERMLINTVEQQSETLRRQWLMWGGDWAEDMDFDMLRPYYEAFSKLPIAIELELINGSTVGLVHAELPDECDWSKVKDLLFNTDPLKVEAIRETSDMLWNKIQPYSSPEKMALVGNVKNIQHVFHGHSIVEDYLTIANRTFMDLGAYKTNRIGIICPSDFI